MLKRERQRTEEANQRTEEIWQEVTVQRKLYDARIQELIDENREERRQSAAMRQAEHQQFIATQQALQAAIAELTAAIAELRQQNQRRSQS